MKTTSINRVIEDFNALVTEEKEMALDIIQKILIEAKREVLSKRAKKAVANLKKGTTKHGSVKDLYKDLQGD